MRWQFVIGTLSVVVALGATGCGSSSSTSGPEGDGTCDLDVYVAGNCSACAIGVAWTVTDSSGNSVSSVVSQSDPESAPEGPGGDIVAQIAPGSYTIQGTYEFS